jgi:hypothetical protein
MRLRIVLPILALAALLLCWGCGYRPTGDTASRLPPDIRTLAVTSIDNRTLDTDLPQLVNGVFRDEITRRGQLKWAERDTADGLVSLTIVSLSESARLEDADGRTGKIKIGVVVRAKVRSRLNDVQVWDSGNVGFSETSFGGDELDARRAATSLAVRRLVDKLSISF